MAMEPETLEGTGAPAARELSFEAGALPAAREDTVAPAAGWTEADEQAAPSDEREPPKSVGESVVPAREGPAPPAATWDVLREPL